MLRLLRDALARVVEDIDTGACEATPEDVEAAVDALRRLTRSDTRMSKHEACRLLGVSRATFDRWVKEGIIPKGRKEVGFNELSWRRDELMSVRKKGKTKSK